MSDAVRPASFPSGPRRSRPKFLPKPAPDLRLLPSRIQRSPIRCKFSHLFPSFFFLLVSWLAYEIIESPARGQSKQQIPAAFFPPFLTIISSHFSYYYRIEYYIKSKSNGNLTKKKRTKGKTQKILRIPNSPPIFHEMCNETTTKMRVGSLRCVNTQRAF